MKDKIESWEIEKKALLKKMIEKVSSISFPASDLSQEVQARR